MYLFHFLGDAPTLPLLQNFPGRNGDFNVFTSILDYTTFGIALLNDEMGTAVHGIAKKEREDGPAIIREILMLWIAGQGTPNHTWGGLLAVLRSPCRLIALADEIEAVVGNQSMS